MEDRPAYERLLMANMAQAILMLNSSLDLGYIINVDCEFYGKVFNN